MPRRTNKKSSVAKVRTLSAKLSRRRSRRWRPKRGRGRGRSERFGEQTHADSPHHMGCDHRGIHAERLPRSLRPALNRRQPAKVAGGPDFQPIDRTAEHCLPPVVATKLERKRRRGCGAVAEMSRPCCRRQGCSPRRETCGVQHFPRELPRRKRGKSIAIPKKCDLPVGSCS